MFDISPMLNQPFSTFATAKNTEIKLPKTNFKTNDYAKRNAIAKLNIRGMYSQAEIMEKTGDIMKLNKEARDMLIREFD